MGTSSCTMATKWVSRCDFIAILCPIKCISVIRCELLRERERGEGGFTINM